MAQLALTHAPAPSPPASPSAPADSNEAIGVLCGKILEGARRLGEFVARNPRLSRERGLDVVAMQLQGIVDRERLAEVGKICAMGSKGKRIMPVDPGLATRLGNAEKLVEDSANEMNRTGTSASWSDPDSAGLGQQQDGGLGLSWLPFAVIGASVLGVVILMQSKKKVEPVKEIPVFERKK